MQTNFKLTAPPTRPILKRTSTKQEANQSKGVPVDGFTEGDSSPETSLLNPKSVAVVGGTDQGGPGTDILKNLQRGNPCGEPSSG